MDSDSPVTVCRRWPPPPRFCHRHLIRCQSPTPKRSSHLLPPLQTHSSNRSRLATPTLLGLCRRRASHCVPPSQESSYHRPLTPVLPPSRSPIWSCHPPCGGPKRHCTICSVHHEDVTGVGHPQPRTTSTSSEPASWYSPTRSSAASTPCPSQHRRFPICHFFRGRLTIDSHLRSFPGPAAAAKTSASTLRTSSTTSLALATNGPTPHQRCPPSDRRRRRKSYPGEHPTPLAPQINSPCHPIALATAPHHLVDGRRRIWPVPLPATVGSKLPYFLWWAASPSRGRPLAKAG
jgi:hypothetical protein